MSTATDAWTVEAVALIGVFALTLYAIFGGADFGGGVWDLFASGPRRGAQRRAIARAMGPVWETNHVWLIFVIVLLFTCFPSFFALLATRLYVPLMLVLVGIVLRGAAFTFSAHGHRAARTSLAWGAVFGVASTLTPWCFGAAAGSLALGTFAWFNPFAIAIGCFAVAISAQLAAVFLTVESEGAVREDFRLRAIAATSVVAAIGALALLAALNYGPQIFIRLTTGAAGIAVGWAMLLGVAVLALLVARRYVLGRVAVVLEVIAVLCGWYAAQGTDVVPGHESLFATAAPEVTLRFFLWITIAGAVFLIPSLVLLFALFKGRNPAVERG